MRILVTGAEGQLGHDVIEEARGRGHEVLGTWRAASDRAGKENALTDGVSYACLDITDRDAVSKVVRDFAPDAVVHCAAWTAVDDAEDEENRDMVFAANAEGTRNVAEACREANASLIYISTDYVFDGSGTAPWKPDEARREPLNIYGRSKLEGELAVESTLDKYYIVRTSWVYGGCGNNFVRTMLRLAESHHDLRVVNDQIGLPTYTLDLARLIVDMAETAGTVDSAETIGTADIAGQGRYGHYHATNEAAQGGGYISWYDFACEIFRQAGKDVKVIPVTTAEYGSVKATRPLNSRLDTGKLKENGFELLPDWRDALKRYLGR